MQFYNLTFLLGVIVSLFWAWNSTSSFFKSGCKKVFFFVFLIIVCFVAARINVICFAGRATLRHGLLSIMPYDYSAIGAVIGGIIFAYAYCLITKQNTLALMNILSSPCFLCILFERLAERFSDFGWGPIMPAGFPTFLCVPDIYGQQHLALFYFEAICALFLFYHSTAPIKHKRDWIFFESFIVFCSAQIFCESLRSETLRMGFVKIHQVECALIILFLVFRSSPNQELYKKKCLLIVLCMIATVGLCEYALDKLPWIPHIITYTVMIISLFFSALFLIKSRRIIQHGSD